MFYDKFKELCTLHNTNPTQVAKDIGLSNATPTKWKNTGAVPSGKSLNTIAEYFGVSVDFLLAADDDWNLSDSLMARLGFQKEKTALSDGQSKEKNALIDFVNGLSDDEAVRVLASLRSLFPDVK